MEWANLSGVGTPSCTLELEKNTFEDQLILKRVDLSTFQQNKKENQAARAHTTHTISAPFVGTDSRSELHLRFPTAWFGAIHHHGIKGCGANQ